MITTTPKTNKNAFIVKVEGSSVRKTSWAPAGRSHGDARKAARKNACRGKNKGRQDGWN